VQIQKAVLSIAERKVVVAGKDAAQDLPPERLHHGFRRSERAFGAKRIAAGTNWKTNSAIQG